MAVHRQFLIRPRKHCVLQTSFLIHIFKISNIPDVKQATGRVVAARRESEPVREECDRIYVGLVARERLFAHSFPDVP